MLKLPTMNINLTDDLAEFVVRQTEEGYGNQSEVIREGLRLLRARQDKRRALMRALEVGMADIAAGRTKLLTDALVDDIAARARRRAKKRAAGTR
jgi:antitoxin ParD1/3/4